LQSWILYLSRKGGIGAESQNLVAYPKLDDEAIGHSIRVLASQVTSHVRVARDMSKSCCMIVAEMAEDPASLITSFARRGS
jgi:hypothetical protein